MEVFYRGLTISDNGIVKGKCNKRIGNKNIKNGYRYVALNGKQVLEHRLIWEAFMGEIPEGMEIDHINTIRDDNRLSNLRLVTSKQNKRNPITKNRYSVSNKGKSSYKQMVWASMYMWMMNQIKKYHKNGNQYIYQI